MTDDSKHYAEGPFTRLERVAGLTSLRRTIIATVAITWLPMALFALIGRVFGQETDPFLFDLSVHSRFLISLPLFLCAERLLAVRSQTAIDRLLSEAFIPPEEVERAKELFQRATRFQCSALPEIVILLLAYAVGVSTLIGLLAPAGFAHGIEDSGQSLARVWYSLIALPLLIFVFWRQLLRWCVWARVLIGIARIPLELMPVHADRRGGIGFLKSPSVAFGIPFLAGVSATLCAGWGTQLVFGHAKLNDFKPSFIAFVVCGIAAVLLPLLSLLPRLHNTRRQGLRKYGMLVTEHARVFQSRWIGEKRDDMLGNPDFQSMADLSTAYQENIEKMRFLLFDVHDVIMLVAAAIIPAVPLMLTELPTSEVLRKLLQLFTGGIAG